MDAIATDALRAELGNAGLADGHLVLSNGSVVRAAVTQHREHPQGHVVMMTSTLSMTRCSRGIDETTVGAGATREAAVERAAKVWIDGNLAGHQGVFNTGNEPDVQYLDVAAADVAEKKSWFGRCSSGRCKPSACRRPGRGFRPADDEILQAIINPVTTS